MHISKLLKKAQKFSKRLNRVKNKNPQKDFTWYPYDIMSNVAHLDNLLTGPNREIFSKLGNERIADVGAADGDLAFLLESAGLPTDIIDYGPTNWNGLQGARQLQKLLHSKTQIHEIDLDGYFEMPRPRYGMTLMLGILYHLKNPFYVLELFARYSDYLIISTRIAQYAMDKTPIRGQPLAYLLAPDECNNDATNYWIFSEAGLWRIMERAGWEILDYRSIGDTESSNPAAHDRDERAFVFARSRKTVV